MVRTFIVLAVFLQFTVKSFPQEIESDFRYEDRIRFKEAMAISNEYGEMLWKGWNKPPFAILFVTDSNEYLFNHPAPGKDFVLAGYDSVLKADIYKRKRVYQKNFLAAFSAVNELSTIVVGTPENTGRSSIYWIIAVLHEHFHQLQSYQDDYLSSIDALALSGDDSTGMWMLNYPFPYDDKEIAGSFNKLTFAAKNAAFAKDAIGFENNLKLYFTERAKFKSLLSEKDYRYFSLQIWQEGLAMYSEVKFLELIKDKRIEPEEIQNLEDYIPYDEQYTKTIENIRDVSTAIKLEESKRACFYYLGALEGLILDRVNPGWRDLYFNEKFYIENYY